MNADERDEIAASVAAHAELGPRYDGAVAEGLVERIGEEIDRRVEARLRGLDYPARGPEAPRPRPAPPAPAPAPARSAPAEPAHRRGNGVTGMFLGLGSMGLGVGATAVVVSHHVASAAAFLMVLLIWAAIAVINVAHAQRR
ncbi:MAG TPA: hypothetical protein VG164_16075 [Trebonia sp.]|nr:hypothetical protein [Trebonia sp.]